MLFTDKDVVLKDGRTCRLRSPTAADAEALLAYLRQVSGESGNLLREAEEVTMTVGEEAQFIERVNQSAGSLLLTAFCGGRLVGNLGLDPVGPMRKVRHRASVGLAVVRDCWGQGLGTILLAEALQAARQLGYEQVELEVLAPNQRGLALYERAGFVAYGRRERAVCQKDGRYEAEILMYKTL